ncbi:hypothetical protein AVEN_189662-1 [Araneus ventricosus]|uniref:Uncharacterized protein n=1 Tax=Araneus ventricosus TaxID=182803 RepID=A0A4Y2M2T4_ARAVE|nr:hypothetical protein AVEN_189662-1 [Araneus ventricosus]
MLTLAPPQKATREPFCDGPPHCESWVKRLLNRYLFIELPPYTGGRTFHSRRQISPAPGSHDRWIFGGIGSRNGDPAIPKPSPEP